MTSKTIGTIIGATGLKCECLDRPLGLDTPVPRLSWRIRGEGRNLAQSAYRITAASEEDALIRGDANMWDSGRIESPQTLDIPYAGVPLEPFQRVFWRVQIWDGAGAEAVASPISWFETGPLSEKDWHAAWLTVADAEERANRAAGLHWIWGDYPLDAPPVKFRYRFKLENPPAHAELLLSAKDNLLGIWLDGSRLDIPEKTVWGTMTKIPLPLSAGPHLLCVEASADTEGFLPADGGAMAALIRIEAKDGAVSRLTTASGWRAGRTGDPDWTAPGFDDGNWKEAVPSRANATCEPWPAGPAMCLRRKFTVTKPVVRARLYATALGAYEAYLNGARVGDARLTPEVSIAEDHLFCQTYDVTELLQTGDNAIGVQVGDGWLAGAFAWRSERFALHDGPRRFSAMLVLDYADGCRERLITDEDWRTASGPVQRADIYNGETYDARDERTGWTMADFDDAGWSDAEIAPVPAGTLLAQPGPKIRANLKLRPIAMTEPKPGIFVFDFGQNFSGWCRMHVRGKAGTQVALHYAELLFQDGTADQTNLRIADATDRYTLKGDAAGETYEPHFTYHGFRYVELRGYPGRPDFDTLEGICAYSAAPETGKMRIFHPLVQKIWNNALWSQRANFFGVPTDCPQRDERMGWTGDIQVFLDAASFNMDTDAFIRRFLAEMRAGQIDGAYPVVTPQPRSFAPMLTAGWSEAGIILPWTLYRRYGDTMVVRENWQAMTAWMNRIARGNPDGMWRTDRGIDLGDWLSVDAIQPADETTPRILAATAYWAYAAELMTEMAQAIGLAAEADNYARLRAKIGEAFARELVSTDGTVGNGSQTGYVLALRFGLVPEPLRAAAAAKLRAEIEGRGTRLSTGFLGTPYILDVLIDAGHADLAVSLLLQTEYPSWGYMISKGATTMWERWNSDTGDLAMNSYNHYAFGAVVGTFYRRLAGISPAAPGFARLRVDPVYDPRIGKVEAEYVSVRGRIATAVSGDDKAMTRLQLTVPPNTKAEVVLPAAARAWREDGRILTAGADGRTIVEAGSGDYDFRAI